LRVGCTQKVSESRQVERDSYSNRVLFSIDPAVIKCVLPPEITPKYPSKTLRMAEI